MYSRTTTWVFRAGPIVGAGGARRSRRSWCRSAGSAAPLAFSGDLILFAYLLGLARFFTVAAALDTGSSFEGMGASREVTFARWRSRRCCSRSRRSRATTGSALALGDVRPRRRRRVGARGGRRSASLAGALVIVFLAENARIPVDDPTTHLELTMIHEVMVLDHGGPDLAFILYGSALKLWVLGALLVGLVVPVRTGSAAVDTAAALAGMIVLAVVRRSGRIVDGALAARARAAAPGRRDRAVDARVGPDR